MKQEIRGPSGKIGDTRIVNTTPLKAIKLFCIECMGHQQNLVEGCTDPLCINYPYRMGKDPDKKGIGSDGTHLKKFQFKPRASATRKKS